ncbi:transcriptional regulator [Cellulomonas bogoriensis 69B4 = DSM 16987]|uniref:Transcriptional regulator n=1 Tax=Cellulomonas bogoriensis 69B4 = DSM 16987 TaxID=1386082 RepID=A0A0A0BS12_9CELL|nr:transcriptional regulator [Cellulomonas bogoriensis 69B4 = DSM 16987]
MRHARGLRRHPLLRSVALGVVAVLSFSVAGGAAAFTRLQGNINTAQTDHLLGERPAEVDPDPNDPSSGRPVNILVMGTDSREGNRSIAADEIDGERSDTTILVHISADRERIELISIPRDSMVAVPECERSDGTVAPARSRTMFNESFAAGGRNGSTTDAAACTQKTVEQLTGVYVHHFVVVDMSGFIEMVDALGGIPMCIEQDMYSRKARLDIQAGKQVFDGETALAFARARTGQGLGDGSDTGRIGRQQELLAATAREVLSANLLTDVPELLRFLDAATRSLTVSSDLSRLTDMSGLAFSLRNVPSGNIAFMTVPFGADPVDPNRVVWTHEAADLWDRVANDRPIIEPEPEPQTQAPAGEGDDAPEAPDEDSSTTDEREQVRPGVDAFTADDKTTVCG